MLNTTSTPAAQSVMFDEIFTDSAKIVADTTIGQIFSEDNFAKGWNDIYVRPSSLSNGTVEKGMRCITSPTILITTKNARMAFVLATKEEPVYLPKDLDPLSDGSFLLAYSILPVISPEFLYYMCKYGDWQKMVNSASRFTNEMFDLGLNWEWGNIGKIVCKGSWQIDEFTCEPYYDALLPKDIMQQLRVIELPSIQRQKELVEAASSLAKKIVKASKPNYEVSELVNKYMAFTNSHGLFRSSCIGLIGEAYRIAAGNHAKTEVLEILKDYEFKKDVLTVEELSFLSKHLNEMFAIAVASNGITYHPSDGFVQPQEVTDFMCKIASFPENVTAYNPFAGSNSYAIALPNHVVGEELNSTTWALGQIRLFANNAEQRTDITLGDSFTSMRSPEKFSAIITSPVYLIEEGHEISDIVNMLYDKLEDGGKLVCIVSAGFLFRKDRKVRTVRDKLIKDRAISSVIMLPSNIFTGTGVSQATLVITKGVPNEEIMFADATGYTRFAKSVYRATTFDSDQFLKDLEDEIEDYFERGRTIDDTTIGASIDYSELVDSDLTPARYLTPKPSEGIALSEIANEVEELRGKEISAEYFLTGSSIPAAMHRKPFVPIKVEDGKVSTAKKYAQVPENAVILALVSGNTRTVYTEGFTGKIAFPAGFIKVLKPINGFSAKYLAAVLSTKIVADQIKAQTVGLTIPRLNKLDLSQILVPVHDTVEEREKLIAEVLSSEMSDLEGELQKTLDSQKREVRSTRHAMIQTLSSLSSKWERFKRFANEQGGNIRLSDMIGRINPTTVEEFMGGIEYAIDTLRRQVDSFRLEKRDWGEPEDINPYEFIESYKANHPSTEYAMQNLGSDNKADVPYFTGENDEEHTAQIEALFTFKAPRALLERIFDNIVSNAKAHGFTSDVTNPTIQFDWQTNGDKIEITIKNNGLPLKDGVSGSDVLMSDFSTALKQKANDGSLHFGIGGFEIKSLMDGIGSVEVISQPDAEFPVKYKLTFNDVNFQDLNLFDN